MKSLSSVAVALVFALATAPAVAQDRAALLHPPAVNPSTPLSTPATSPLAAQIQDDYASQLMGEQRQLLLQQPSGTTRQELAVGRSLEGFTPR